MTYSVSDLLHGARVMSQSVFGVAGADELCQFLSDDKFAHVSVIPSNRPLDKPGYACLVQGEHSLTGGSTYTVTDLPGFERDIWLCPVTLFVLGRYPKYIYVKKNQQAA